MSAEIGCHLIYLLSVSRISCTRATHVLALLIKCRPQIKPPLINNAFAYRRQMKPSERDRPSKREPFFRQFMARQKGKIFRVEPFLSYECGQKCLTESYTAANGSLIMLTTRNGPPKVNPLCASLSLPLSLSLSFARSCHLPLSFAYKFSLLATLRRAHLLDYINLGQVGALCVSATPCYLPIPLLPLLPLLPLPHAHAQADRAQTTCVLPSLAGKTTQRTKLCLSVSVRRGRAGRGSGRGKTLVCVCIWWGLSVHLSVPFWGFCFFVSPHGRRAL